MSRKLTRDEVVKRAIHAFWYIYYGWGCHPSRNKSGFPPLVSEFTGLTMRATDCGGYTAWCWGLGVSPGAYSWGSGGKYEYHAKDPNATELTMESIFPGILPGDVVWRRSKESASGNHVGIYVGNNEVIQASTASWQTKFGNPGSLVPQVPGRFSTQPGARNNGYGVSYGVALNFDGYARFKPEYSGDVPDDFPEWDIEDYTPVYIPGGEGEQTIPPNFSETYTEELDGIRSYFRDKTYIRHFQKFRYMRKVK